MPDFLVFAAVVPKLLDRYGQDTIIAAVAMLRDELPDLRLVLTGRGTRIPQPLDHIAARGLRDVVRFAGWVSATEFNDILHAADLAQAVKRLHDGRGRLAELAANGRLAQARNGWGAQRGV
jgi:glycosyltransferase involved in cell wall biosynthesis